MKPIEMIMFSGINLFLSQQGDVLSEEIMCEQRVESGLTTISSSSRQQSISAS